MLSAREEAHQPVPFRWAHDIHGRQGKDLLLRTRKAVQRRVASGYKVVVVHMKFIVSKEDEHGRRGAGRRGCTGDNGGGGGSRDTARRRGRRSRDDADVDRKSGRDEGDRRSGQCGGSGTDGTAGDHGDGRKVDGTITIDGVAAGLDEPLH